MNQVEINIQALINDIPVIVSDILLSLGNDAKALIQQRVQENGKDSKGGSTPKYSPGYEKYRQRRGRQVGFMDLTLSGEMWRSIGVTEKKQDGKNSIITVAGRDQLTQTKIDAHSEKRFVVLELSTDEEGILSEVFNKEMGTKALEYLNRGT